MAQIPALMATLKKQLKIHGYTYSDIAPALNISEASVKRLFAEQSFNLQRLEILCQLMGLKLSELVALMEQEQPQLQQLSLQQEQEIVQDPLLLMIAINVVNQHSFDELCHEITISETECIRKLVQLDRLRIIELLPNNRIKLLISPNFKWRVNGPIQQFFQDHVKQYFFDSAFAKKAETLWVLNGELGEASRQDMQRQMEKLAKHCNELIAQDQSLPKDQRQHTTTVLASRPWRLPLFDQYRREQ